MSTSQISTVSCILTTELDNELFEKIELVFNIVLDKITVQESPVGPTHYLPLFESQTFSGSLKLVGFSDAYFPKELDLHFTGTEEQRRLFCALVNAWDGTVLQRQQWLRLT